MRDQLLINDLHLGARRVAGTTPASAMLIRRYLIDKLRELLFAHLDKDAIINGDLFDAFWIEVLDALEFYAMAREWLIESGKKMKVGRGNHDVSKDSAKLSTFDMVCRILAAEFPDQFEAITGPAKLADGIFMIPHMPNQDLFDLELDRVPNRSDGTPGLLLLHANYNNHFAMESDHSLNVSEEQAKRLIAAGWTLIFGHEHQARTELNGGVIVTGNQFPSSVADCLNNPDGYKWAHILRPALLGKSNQFDATPWIARVQTWSAEDDFAEIDWVELAGSDTGARFVRVTGKATAEQAANVLEAVARFRKDNPDVFVVMNAVVVEGVADVGELKATAENIRSFDVLGYLLEQLDEAQAAKVRELIGKDENRVKEAA